MPVLAALAVSTALLSAGACRAEQLLFTLSGTDTATFELASEPTVQSQNDLSIGFGPVKGTFDGVATTFADLRFGSFVYAPALVLGGMNDYYGSQIFTGSKDHPVFAPGLFSLTGGDGVETLAISQVSAAPEPTLWAFMSAGVFGLGFALRRRKSGMPAT